MRFLALIIFLPALAFADSGGLNVQDLQPDASWKDGKIVFRAGYVPVDLESALAASGIKFNNFTDFDKCSKSTSTAQSKIDDLLPSEAKAKAVQIQAVKDAIAAK